MAVHHIFCWLCCCVMMLFLRVRSQFEQQSQNAAIPSNVFNGELSQRMNDRMSFASQSQTGNLFDTTYQPKFSAEYRSQGKERRSKHRSERRTNSDSFIQYCCESVIACDRIKTSGEYIPLPLHRSIFPPIHSADATTQPAAATTAHHPDR